MDDKNVRKGFPNRIYCPACGEWQDQDTITSMAIMAAPRWMEFRCPSCKTRWMIAIEFKEQHDER